jgi:formate dehydrogenase maturation protein FdhE
MVAVARFVIDKTTTVGISATQAVSDAQAQVNSASQQVELARAQVTHASQYATASKTQAGYAKQSADNAKSYLDNLIATAQDSVNSQLTTALGQLNNATSTQTQVITDLVNLAISQVAQDVAVAVQQASLAQNSATMAQIYAQALIATSSSAITI